MDSFDDRQIFSPSNKNIQQKSYEQPETHKKNKSFLECFICCQSSDNDLTQNQLHLFYTLKPLCNTLYDENNKAHQENLKELYLASFEQNLNAENLCSDEWMKMGFQNKNAQTDFRGAGLIGLKNLFSFVKLQKKTFQEMCLKENEFLFAMTSLNITFYMKIYFHLADYLSYKKDKKLICSREALKNFTLFFENFCKNQTGFCFEDTLQNCFYEIHEILLIFCFNKWLSYRKSNKETSLMDFHNIFEEMKRNFKVFMDTEGHITLSQMRDYFLKFLLHSNTKEIIHS